MRGVAIPCLKFVGTVSLGLFTGISYTSALYTIPALLTLPSASSANHTYATYIRTSSQALLRLATLSVTSYTLAYALSPSGYGGGRHPYLLWTSLATILAHSVGVLMNKRELNAALQKDPKGKAKEDWVNLQESTVDMNGEEVKEAIKRYGGFEGLRAGLGGLAFLMGVVGIWGDGARV